MQIMQAELILLMSLELETAAFHLYDHQLAPGQARCSVRTQLAYRAIRETSMKHAGMQCRASFLCKHAILRGHSVTLGSCDKSMKQNLRRGMSVKQG